MTRPNESGSRRRSLIRQLTHEKGHETNSITDSLMNTDNEANLIGVG